MSIIDVNYRTFYAPDCFSDCGRKCVLLLGKHYK